ncbi:cytochrome P450 [Actinoplanes sp. NPDC049548]|uniref:cytochrome P450 n=1 Tax=Actinoplanes sp. NPDC049548 TaxID=3155152 RepID=UPI0034173FDD
MTLRTAPGKWPLIGHAVPFARRPLEFLEAQRSCGKVVRVHLGRRPTYIVNDPEFLRRLLTTDAGKVSKGLLFDKLRPLLGNGLLNSEGEFHRRQRKLIQPAFHREQIARYVAAIAAESRAVSARWTDREVVRLERETSSLVIGSITASLFSAAISAHGVRTIQECLPQVLDGTFRRLIASSLSLDLLPNRRARQFDTAVARIQEVIREILRSRSADGLPAVLLAARGEDGEQAMTEDQLVDEVMTLLMAGTDTTAGALNFAFDGLGRNPVVEGRLHAELDRVLAGRTDVTAEDLPKLDYTRRVAMEAVRLAAPWLLTRRAEVPLEFGDVSVPAGADILFSPHSVNRNPDFHPHPDRFDPDRWLPERVRLLPRGAMISFGMGRRQCIGESFALTAMTVHLAGLCARWQLRPVAGRPTRRTVTAGMERTVELSLMAVARSGPASPSSSGGSR